jgi:hypothetical protein
MELAALTEGISQYILLKVIKIYIVSESNAAK